MLTTALGNNELSLPPQINYRPRETIVARVCAALDQALRAFIMAEHISNVFLARLISEVGGRQGDMRICRGSCGKVAPIVGLSVAAKPVSRVDALGK